MNFTKETEDEIFKYISTHLEKIIIEKRETKRTTYHGSEKGEDIKITEYKINDSNEWVLDFFLIRKITAELFLPVVEKLFKNFKETTPIDPI